MKLTKLSILPQRGNRSVCQPDRPRLPDAPLDFKACSEHAPDHVKVGDKVVCHLRRGEGGGLFGEGEEQDELVGEAGIQGGPRTGIRECLPGGLPSHVLGVLPDCTQRGEAGGSRRW